VLADAENVTGATLQGVVWDVCSTNPACGVNTPGRALRLRELVLSWTVQGDRVALVVKLPDPMRLQVSTVACDPPPWNV
jgi:hypothetical protein